MLTVDGSTWQIETVDNAIDSLYIETNIVVDSSNNPHIAYNGATRERKYAHWNCGHWEIETLPGSTAASSSAGYSLRLDSSDNPILYIMRIIVLSTPVEMALPGKVNL